MPFLRSQNRGKNSEPVMKEAPVKSLAPITFRITADVKPKPIVAEIKVPASSITMSTLASTAPQVERKSRFPFPPVKVPPPPPAPLQVHQATIINVDEAESVDESSSSSPRLSPVAAAGGDFDLNTAMILSTAPESPEDSPTFTTALSLLAPTTTTNTSTNTTSQGSSPTPDPSLLASLLQRAGVATTASTMHQLYYPGQLVHQLQQIQHVQQQAAVVETALLQTFNSCQSAETMPGMERRRRIVGEINTLVKQWIRTEGMHQGMDWQQVERTGGKVVTYGSFKLGVVERDSDLDLLAVVPRHVTREDFFTNFYHHLAKKNEVSELRALSKAFVPVIKFKYKDIDVDLTMARLMCNEKIPEDEDFLMYHIATAEMDARCLRSLNGFRATRELLQLVPDVNKFHVVLRIVKLWAKRQGIYGNMLGFLGGASWAILVAKACQLEGEQYPVQQPLVYLVVLFFKVFSVWPWPTPVYIREQVGPQPSGAWNPLTNHWDRDHVMPIITSSIPQMNSAVNVDEENLALIKKKLTEAADICTKVFEGSRKWEDLVRQGSFFEDFEFFIDVMAKARKDAQMWFGSVESKLRHLTMMLRRCPKVASAHIWPVAFPKPRKPGGFMSQSWYIGIKLLDGVKMDVSHVREPMDVFTDLCDDSARQLHSSNFHSTFEMFWELVERSKLPVAVVGKKKPSYAAALTQGKEQLLSLSRTEGSNITSSAGSSQPSVLPAQYQQSPMTTSLVGSKPGFHAPPATPELLQPPMYYHGITSPREATSLPRQSPTSSITSSCSRPSQGRGVGLRDGYHQSPYSTPYNTPSLDHLPSYPPLTSVPPPPSQPATTFSPHQFKSPPPPVPATGLPSRKPGCVCGGGSHDRRRDQIKGSESETSDRLRSVSWTSDKFPPPGLGLARVAHQDQLPPSISPGFRDVVSGVVPLLQHCDTSMPPPPIPPPAPSQPQQQQAAPPSPLSCCAEDKPLTFDSARLNARRKERLRSPRTSLSEIADLGSPRPVCNPGSQAIRVSLAVPLLNDNVFT